MSLPREIAERLKKAAHENAFYREWVRRKAADPSFVLTHEVIEEIWTMTDPDHEAAA